VPVAPTWGRLPGVGRKARSSATTAPAVPATKVTTRAPTWTRRITRIRRFAPLTRSNAPRGSPGRARRSSSRRIPSSRSGNVVLLRPKGPAQGVPGPVEGGLGGPPRRSRGDRRPQRPRSRGSSGAPPPGAAGGTVAPAPAPCRRFGSESGSACAGTSRSRALRSAISRRHRLRERFMATVVTHAARDSIRSPRSERSQARASASHTASSAAGRLSDTIATAATTLGYSSSRNALMSSSSSSPPSTVTTRERRFRLPRRGNAGETWGRASRPRLPC
jgi:hypothetical protein